MNEYTGKYVELKHWARKDITRTFDCRNLYKVIKETEKAVYCEPVDYIHNEPEYFWAPKSAITNIEKP